jgi:hypothetical protein
VKKLISIGVALALLAMVVLPLGVGADSVVPTTYAKIPFAIVQSGFYLVGCMLGDLGPILTALGVALPGGLTLDSFQPILNMMGDWVGTPLAWSVDMMIAGVTLVADVMTPLEGLIDAVAPGALPDGLLAGVAGLLETIETDLKACYPTYECNNVSNVYTPCS